MLQTSTWKGFSCAGRWGYFTSNWDQKLSADMADALKIGHIDWEANCNWKALIHKSVRLHISWQNLGAEGIADKELLLGCHLLVEEPQLLPVEICPPLVSSSYPPGGVEVEDTLRTFLKIALCQTTTYLGHWSPIKHLVPKITFRVSQGWSSGSCLTTVILQHISFET